MKYILEIYHEGDCIEQREKDEPFMAPAPGEQISLSFQNTNYSDEHGNWWLVKKRKFLYFGADTEIQTMMLYCVPDPAKGYYDED